MSAGRDEGWAAWGGLRSAMAFADVARKAAEPTLRALEAHERAVAPTRRLVKAAQQAAEPARRAAEAHQRQFDQVADLLRHDQGVWIRSALEAASAWTDQYDAVLQHLNVPAIEAAGRAWAERYESVIGHLDFEVPPDLMPLIEEAGESLAASEPSEVMSETALVASQDGPGADRFVSTLGTFITAALATRDFTAAAYLLTVRGVQRTLGYQAARRALATFVALVVTLAWAAWLVNDAGKHTSEALKDAAEIPVTVLVTVWLACGGKKRGED